MILWVSCAMKTPGCGKRHLPVPDRPEPVNKPAPPPLGAFVFGLPFASKKNGKRASRVGPVEVMNDGMLLVEPLTIPLAITCDSGLVAGLVPSIVGCH